MTARWRAGLEKVTLLQLLVTCVFFSLTGSVLFCPSVVRPRRARAGSQAKGALPLSPRLFLLLGLPLLLAVLVHGVQDLALALAQAPLPGLLQQDLQGQALVHLPDRHGAAARLSLRWRDGRAVSGGNK